MTNKIKANKTREKLIISGLLIFTKGNDKNKDKENHERKKWKIKKRDDTEQEIIVASRKADFFKRDHSVISVPACLFIWNFKSSFCILVFAFLISSYITLKNKNLR